jgi:uncharacterized protein DUF982
MTDEPEITLEAAPHVGAALLLKYNGSMTDNNLPGAMRPVSIYIGGGRTRVVSSLWAAAEVLFGWPGSKTCEHYKRAVIACLAAYEDDRPLDELHEALVRAAKAAGIFIEDRREKAMRER